MSETAWHNVLNEMTAVHGPSARAWLASAVLSDGPDGALLLNLPNAFVRDVLRERCGEALRKAARSEGYSRVDLRVVDVRRPEQTTFASFRVSEGNQLAYAAVTSLARRLRSEIHPLVLQGPEGCGKTHLISALRDVAMARQVSPVISTDPGRLSRRLGLAAKAGRLGEFRFWLRSCRLLLVDQADRLQGKTKTQTELIHALDALAASGGVAVLALREPPSDLSESLGSRLRGGLWVNIDVTS